MFTWLHPYAKTERAYALCNTLLPYFFITAVAGLLVGFVWGLLFAPSDYQQGDSFRIIYVHVPSAILSMSTYVAMAVAGFVGLVWQWKTAYMSMIAIAPVGAVLTFISLFTGAAWGKPMWGTWWIWDARLTSQLILFFLYLGVMALYAAFSDKTQATRYPSLDQYSSPATWRVPERRDRHDACLPADREAPTVSKPPVLAQCCDTSMHLPHSPSWQGDQHTRPVSYDGSC